jgi:hypothetical protein
MVIRVMMFPLLPLMVSKQMKSASSTIASFHSELILNSDHCDSKGMIITMTGMRFARLAPPSLIMNP